MIQPAGDSRAGAHGTGIHGTGAPGARRRDAWTRGTWTVAVLALAAAAIGWRAAPTTFSYAWLAAVSTWLGWPLGCMGLLLIHALTGGRWGQALRPQWLAGMNTLPLLLPALLPLLLELPRLYPWARPDAAAHLHNAAYLNVRFFALRGLLYLAVWFTLAQRIRTALRQPQPGAALARLAPAGLILLVLTMTYAAIDTTMSLDPDFASSAYGLIAIAAAGLLALSASLFAATFTPGLYGAPHSPAAADGAALADSLGQLLLGLVLLWVYLDFMQALIIWQSDLASDAPWYVLRTRGGWGTLTIVIAIGHFALPFCLLIWPALRRSRPAIRAISALLIVAEVVRGWWLVVPASGAGVGLVDVAAMVGVLAAAAAVALRSPAAAHAAGTARVQHV